MNPIGTLRFAREFLAAGASVKSPPTSPEDAFRCDYFNISIPAYYLICHSIELALKSFLLVQGYTEVELAGKGKFKVKFGHNLKNLYRESVSHGLWSSGCQLDSDGQIIDLMNESYCRKEIVYFSRGLQSFPSYSKIYVFADRLIKSIEKHLSRNENCS